MPGLRALDREVALVPPEVSLYHLSLTETIRQLELKADLEVASL